MWVSLQLLDQLSLQQLRCPHLALNAAIDSLLDHHLHNGSYHIGGGGCVRRDWFGKLLAAAWANFGSWSKRGSSVSKTWLALLSSPQPAGACTVCGVRQGAAFALCQLLLQAPAHAAGRHLYGRGASRAGDCKQRTQLLRVCLPDRAGNCVATNYATCATMSCRAAALAGLCRAAGLECPPGVAPRSR